MAEGLRCTRCGDLWLSSAAAVLIAKEGGCLTCGGELRPEALPQGGFAPSDDQPHGD